MGDMNKYDYDFCEYILTKDVMVKRSPLVILCEGQRKAFKESRSRSISMASIGGGLDKYPDASFWKKTIPSEWKGLPPYFISCGDRSTVIKTYSNLIELNNKLKSSYLRSPEKLFILIDLDVNGTILEEMYKNHQKSKDYEFKNTEEIYHNLYESNPINTKIIDQSKIIITGWRHKECYFFEPDLCDNLYKKLEKIQVYYNDEMFSSEEVYKDMIEAISEDKGINENFDNYIRERIQKLLCIPISDQDTLLNELRKINDNLEISSQEKRKLIEAILKMVNAKLDFWDKAITCKFNDNKLTQKLDKKLDKKKRRESAKENF